MLREISRIVYYMHIIGFTIAVDSTSVNEKGLPRQNNV